MEPKRDPNLENCPYYTVRRIRNTPKSIGNYLGPHIRVRLGSNNTVVGKASRSALTRIQTDTGTNPTPPPPKKKKKKIRNSQTLN